MSPGRTIGILLSACAACVAGLFGAFLFRDRVAMPPIRRDVVTRLMEGERALVTRMGMALAEEGDGTLSGPRGTWSRPIALGPRECVAVVVGTYEHHVPEHLWIDADEGAPPARDPVLVSEGSAPTTLRAYADDDGLVRHVQLCAWAPSALRVVLRSRAHDRDRVTPTNGALRYAIYRAPWDHVGGVTALKRGRVTASALRALGPDVALAQTEQAVPPGEALFGPTVPLRVGQARLVPVSEQTYGLLYTSTSSNANEGVNPRVDLSPVDAGDAWGVARPVGELWAHAMLARMVPAHDAVVEAGRNDFKRVLAAVDRASFGRRCVTLLFTRERYGYAAEVSRFDRGSGTLAPLRRVANVATDTVCPATGLALYVVPDGDQEGYRLQAAAAPEPSAIETPPPADGAPSSRTSRRSRSRE